MLAHNSSQSWDAAWAGQHLMNRHPSFFIFHIPTDYAIALFQALVDRQGGNISVRTDLENHPQIESYWEFSRVWGGDSDPD